MWLVFAYLFLENQLSDIWIILQSIEIVINSIMLVEVMYNQRYQAKQNK